MKNYTVWENSLMGGETQKRWRYHYLQLATYARANAARCLEPEMRDEFLDAAKTWQLMADEINFEDNNTLSNDPLPSERG